jgi:hypothetical protein
VLAALGHFLHSHFRCQQYCTAIGSMLLIVSGNIMNVALQAKHGPWQAWPRARPAQSQQQHPRRHCHGRHIVRGLQVPDEPEYDDLKLDDAYFKELGIDEDEQEAHKTYEPDDIGAACGTAQHVPETH